MWGQRIKAIDAQAAAHQIIQLYSITKPEEIVIEDIAMARGVYVIEGPLSGAEARLIRDKENGLIRVNSNISLIEQKRSAIAHELGHWELHKDISQIDLYSEKGMPGYASSNPYEVEASIFASQLLMPIKLFRPRCESLTPTLNNLKQLAAEFNTTLTSTALRYVEESEYSCAVVFSKDGKVLWWKRSDSCREIWIEPGQKVSSNTLANKFFVDDTALEEKGRVPFASWVPDSKYRIEEISEQSIRLGRYVVVLTLLWID